MSYPRTLRPPLAKDAETVPSWETAKPSGEKPRPSVGYTSRTTTQTESLKSAKYSSHPELAAIVESWAGAQSPGVDAPARFVQCHAADTTTPSRVDRNTPPNSTSLQSSLCRPPTQPPQ